MSAVLVSNGDTNTINDSRVDTVTLEPGSVLEAPNLECVSGWIIIRAGARLKAPRLKQAGSIALAFETRLVAPALEQITYRLQVAAGGGLMAGKLSQIDGAVELSSDAELVAGELRCVNSLKVGARVRLATPKLWSVSKGLHITPEAIVELPSLQEVGHLRLDGPSELHANELGTCGDIYAGKGASLRAPALKGAATVYLSDFTALDLPELRIITGDLALGHKAQLHANELKEAHGDVFFGEAASVTTAVSFMGVEVAGNAYYPHGKATGGEWVMRDEPAVAAPARAKGMRV